jgi:hypothetical protein
MKLPAVAIAAAFACGIVAGLDPPVASQATTPVFLARRFARLRQAQAPDRHKKSEQQ